MKYTGEEAPPPSFRKALGVWARIGILSFGGPAAQIALMHRMLVDEHRWLSEKRFLNALSFCMMLPGPEAMQLATWAGWRMHGIRGGLAAGLSFVLPGALVVLVLAMIYAVYGATPVVQAVFLGIKAAVLIIVAEALLRISKRALIRRDHWLLAGSAFIAIFFLAVPFPFIVLAAAVYGYATARDDTAPEPSGPLPWRSVGRTALIWSTIWILPLLGLAWTAGADDVLTQIGILFSKLAVVTFGGAYAVLAYLGQEAAVNRDWLTPEAMIDGLGLAETTPGPLILVTEFVAYLAAHRQGGTAYGVLGAFVGLWATFAPCFLWVFTGAPFIDRLDRAPRLRGALTGITAAVVGVILNLAVWFALHAVFATVQRQSMGPIGIWLPEIGTLDGRVLALAALSAVLLLVLRWSVPLVLAAMAGLGLLLGAVTG